MKMRSRLIYDSGSSWLQGLAAGQDFIWIDLHMARSHVTYRCRFLPILFSLFMLVMLAMFVILAFCTGYALLLNGVADPLISCICSTHDLCLHSGRGYLLLFGVDDHRFTSLFALHSVTIYMYSSILPICMLYMLWYAMLSVDMLVYDISCYAMILYAMAFYALMSYAIICFDLIYHDVLYYALCSAKLWYYVMMSYVMIWVLI